MLRYCWLIVFALSVVIAVLKHRLGDLLIVVQTLPLHLLILLSWLIGFLLLWNGLLSMLKALGFVGALARWLSPVLRRLFPADQVDSETLGFIALNMSANVLGMGNAATPAGLSAMKGFESSNPEPGRATHAMCLFLAINTSSVQLVPASALALLAASGFPHPFSILIPTWIVTSFTTLVAIAGAKCCAALSLRKERKQIRREYG